MLTVEFPGYVDAGTGPAAAEAACAELDANVAYQPSQPLDGVPEALLPDRYREWHG